MSLRRFAVAATIVLAATPGLAEEAAPAPAAEPEPAADAPAADASAADASAADASAADASAAETPAEKSAAEPTTEGAPPSALDVDPSAYELEPPEPFDARVPSGIALGLFGGLMTGAGIAALNDSEPGELGSSLAVGAMFGGVTALFAGATFLGYAGAEGADIPRRSHRRVVVGQILTGVGLAATTMFSVALIHGYYEQTEGRLVSYLGLAPAGGLLIAGAPVWLAGARDAERLVDGPTRAVMRSPAMAVVGGATTLAGLGACGTSIVIIAGDEEDERQLLAGTLGLIGATTTSLGAALLIFGLSDAEIPSNLPEIAVGPASAQLRLALD